MKNNNKKFEISFIKYKPDFDDIEEVYCDSKSLFNKIMLTMSVFFVIVVDYLIGKTFYFDFVVNNSFNFNFSNIISILGILLITISPTIYYILKMKNFKFHIDNEKLDYKDIFGRTFSYSINEILEAKFFAFIGEATSDNIVIEIANKRKIKISSTDRNFELLKLFLISKNLLV